MLLDNVDGSIYKVEDDHCLVEVYLINDEIMNIRVPNNHIPDGLRWYGSPINIQVTETDGTIIITEREIFPDPEGEAELQKLVSKL